MPDRAFFPLMALCAIILISLALVWPQGLGRRSPKPFGYETASQIAARTPKLRPSSKVAPVLPGPILSPALAPEPSSAPPPPMVMPTPVTPPSPAPSPAPLTTPSPANTVQP